MDQKYPKQLMVQFIKVDMSLEILLVPKCSQYYSFRQIGLNCSLLVLYTSLVQITLP